ncbi:MAG: nitroreductase family protein [Armatimonadota bacterium]|nr:MAG: nitroreductase family protein [Armatimonadota bacterium]
MSTPPDSNTARLAELLRRRHSVRRFEDRPVPQDVIRRALDMARWAPSSANRQPWHFVIITDEGTRSELAASARAALFDINAHLREAPAVIAACSDPRVTKWYLYDVSAAIMCLLLALDSLGLGACWVGLFDEERVKELLGIPEPVHVAALIPIGYPAEQPPPSPRLEVDEIAFWQRWGERDPAGHPVPLTRFGRRGVPSVVWKAIRNLVSRIPRRHR